MTGSCYCLDTFRQGDLNGAANVNVVTCSRLKWLAGEGSAGLRFHASVPLYAHGRRLGVMNVASVEWRQLSAEDLRVLHTVGDMLGIAIERAQLYARGASKPAMVEERNRLARESTTRSHRAWPPPHCSSTPPTRCSTAAANRRSSARR